jgi:hypothetical protein
MCRFHLSGSVKPWKPAFLYLVWLVLFIAEENKSVDVGGTSRLSASSSSSSDTDSSSSSLSSSSSDSSDSEAG